MAVIDSPKEVAAILADIGTSIVFDPTGKVIGSSGFPPTMASAAVDKHIREYGVTQNVIRKDNRAV